MRSAIAPRWSPVVAAEAGAAPGQEALARAVAVQLFRLMAIKDEYEVARLFTDGTFEAQLGREFAAWDRLDYHLAPPLLAAYRPGDGAAGEAALRAVDGPRPAAPRPA